MGQLLYLLTDKNLVSGGRYFTANAAELIVRNVINDFKKSVQQERSDTNNGFICRVIVLIY